MKDCVHEADFEYMAQQSFFFLYRIEFFVFLLSLPVKFSVFL